MKRETLTLDLEGRGAYEITEELDGIIAGHSMRRGLCHVFIHHTSASLVICENADPVVLSDLETFLSTWVPDGHRMFKHMDEGNDDMPAHIRTVMTHSSLTLPIENGALDLGNWQGVFVYEHRAVPFTRRLTVTLQS
ncbi:MAG: secondary thiamine-phosphate synthase enzyme YjbQ [Pseudomonadota bacterium]